MRRNLFLGMLAVSTLLVASGNFAVASAASEPTIGVTLAGLSNPYLKSYDRGILLAAKKYHVNVIVLDAQNSVTNQANEVQDLITRGVKGIIVNPVDQQAIIPALKAAHDAGIPVDTGNMNVAPAGYPYITAYTGPNDVTEGAAAAALMVRALHGKGKVGVIIGTPGDSPSVNRLKGFRQEFAKYPGMKIVGVAVGQWQKSNSLTAAQNLLSANPGLNGILTEDDTMAAGAIEALQQAGVLKKIVVVGIGDSQIGAANIKAGLMYGTTDQSPITDAAWAIKTMVAILNHHKVPKLNYIPTPQVTRANLSHYPAQW